MPKRCPRCGRHHSGACGIPGVVVGVEAGTIGARAAQDRISMPNSFSVRLENKPKQRTSLTKQGLEELLEWGVEQERRMVEMLKVLPSEMPEYQRLLERLDKVNNANRQVRVQIALKRS